MKRIFDICMSLVGLIIFSPLFLIMAVMIKATSKGGVFYRGIRVGIYGKPFRIFKFRSMVEDAEQKGKLNVSDTDDRITSVGHFLRKSKIDELPQLINVLFGNMSFVGPRPELEFYVKKYSSNELSLLELKPGITDWASIANFKQFKFFTESADPDIAYLSYLRPLKLQLQFYYKDNISFQKDIKIIFWTLYKILFQKQTLPKEIDEIVNKYKDMNIQNKSIAVSTSSRELTI